MPNNRTGTKHTEETKKKLREARQDRKPNKPKEMLGKRFDRWIVLEFAGKKNRQYIWLCRCDCGNERIVSGGSLRSGQSKSCGCIGKELIAQRNRKNCGEKNPMFGKIGIWADKRRPEHSEQMEGDKNPNWKGGITSEIQKIRGSVESKEWRLGVFKRDNYICQKYKTRGGKLNPHHILNFSSYPELRFAIDNGITLSEKAHKLFHKIYGIKNNTKEQLEEFLCQ